MTRKRFYFQFPDAGNRALSSIGTCNISRPGIPDAKLTLQSLLHRSSTTGVDLGGSDGWLKAGRVARWESEKANDDLEWCGCILALLVLWVAVAVNGNDRQAILNGKIIIYWVDGLLETRDIEWILNETLVSGKVYRNSKFTVYRFTVVQNIPYSPLLQCMLLVMVLVCKQFE